VITESKFWRDDSAIIPPRLVSRAEWRPDSTHWPRGAGWQKDFDPQNVPIVFDGINAGGTITARDFESTFARYIFASAARAVARLQDPVSVEARRRLMFDAYSAVIAGKASFCRRTWFWLRAVARDCLIAAKNL